jgi:starch phosphorylase
MPPSHYHRPIPEGLEALEGVSDLALDLRWTWSHFSDRLWELLDPEAWKHTQDPYYILQNVSRTRLEEVAADARFTEELRGWQEERRRYLEAPGWFGQYHAQADLRKVAYFSMEFGLSEALPTYSGGLGILAGDYLKTASDLGVPVIGIGLLHQQGYFRQVLTADGWQLEAYPYNDPTMLPVVPVQNHDGGWLRVKLALPGRSLLLRVWLARVGKVPLYLLDSNDPLNSPSDRGITTILYPSEKERRLIQEIVLGIGGWLALEQLGIEVDICHLNEGHAAFAILARAHQFMRNTGQSFPVALRATRVGNLFTTHTPVAAGIDRFEPALIRPYLHCLNEHTDIPVDDILAMGKKESANHDESFNMAYFAMRGSCWINGVSRLHGQVSRQLFQALYPRRPQDEVPIGHITNGVHVPTWDSKAADELWTCTCGKERWLGTTDALCPMIERIGVSELSTLRVAGRRSLIQYVRHRFEHQLREHGASNERIQRAQHALNPNALTLGFARRFAEYKRPNLLLHDPDRLARILLHPDRPAQLIVAGKAYPNDQEGKEMVRAMVKFASRPELFDRVIFLEDHDMTLAQQLATGIDLWINTPRRPWEACGTSGMKVLVNGGLNCSELDGWWAEAYSPEVGWALGDGHEHHEPEWDAHEADQLYQLLEQKIVPEFYARDPDGLPRRWLERVRTSMARLTPQFSSNRMLIDYTEQYYLPAAQAYRVRAADGGKIAAALEAWHQQLADNWRALRFGDVRVIRDDGQWQFTVQVYFGDLDPACVAVELYANPEANGRPVRIEMNRTESISGAVNGYLYTATIPTERPADHFTPRIVPFHPHANVPVEETLILWQR